MNIFYFNDLGEYDEFNPSFFLDRNNAKEIIKYISKEPFIVDNQYLYKNINLPQKEIDFILNGLINIKAISQKSNKYKVNFPTFFEDDVKLIVESIDKYLPKISKEIKPFIKGLNYDQDTLYHLICNDVFDNYAFNYLVDKGQITNDKINVGNRNYLIIGYENSDYVDNLSNKLLCSNNKYKCNEITFNSFGDTDGFRNDFFRYFRLKQMNVIQSKEIDDFFNKQKNEQEFKNKLEGTVTGKIIDSEATDLLENLGYFKNKKINVPIIKREEHLKFAKELMDLVVEDIVEALNNLKELDLVSKRNEVPFEDTANEIWHIMFGLINKKLIEDKIVSAPISYYKEGSYLRCIYVEKKDLQ